MKITSIAKNSMLIFFAVLLQLSSCRNFFVDGETKQIQSSETIEFVIPSLTGTSGNGSASSSTLSDETWSVYALLCGGDTNLNDNLLNKMIVDGATYTEEADFVNAHEHDGILAQQSFIDKKISEPVSISFPNIVTGTQFFIRVLIMQNGRIVYTGTSPEQGSALISGTGGVFSVNKSGLHVVQSGQNIVRVILRKVKSRIYYVKDGGTAVADKSTKDEPAAIGAAIAAVKDTAEPASIILVGDATISSSDDLKTALENAGDIEISSYVGGRHSLTLSSDLKIPEAKELTLENVHVVGGKKLTLAEKALLSLVDVQFTGEIIAKKESAATLSNTSVDSTLTAEENSSIAMYGSSRIQGDFSAHSAKVSVENTAQINGNITLSGSATFTGNVASNDSTITISDSATVTGSVSASGSRCSVTLKDTAKVVGNLSATSATVTVKNTASIDGSITLAGSTTFTGDGAITVRADTSISLSDTAALIVPAGENITVQGTIKLGGSPDIRDVDDTSVPIVLDESNGKWGHIEVTEQLNLSKQLPVAIRNTESTYAPFTTTPVLEYETGISPDYEQFKWEFNIPGVWDFVQETQNSKTVIYIRDAVASRPLWLFEARASSTETYANFYYGTKTYIGQGTDYSFDAEGIFAAAKNVLHLYGKYNSANCLFELSAASSSVTSIGINGDKLLDVYADGGHVYYVHEISNGVEIKQYTGTGFSSVKTVTGSDAAYLGSSNNYRVALCKADTMFLLLYMRSSASSSGHTGDDVLLAVPETTGKIDKYTLPVLHNTVRTDYNDILYYGGNVYILAGQCGKSDGTVYSRGGVIKVAKSSNTFSVTDTIYGLATTDTAEGSEDTCFYNPYRFLGTDGKYLIIADDGKTAGDIQKDRVVYFDTENLKIERVYYTDAGFKGKR